MSASLLFCSNNMSCTIVKYFCEPSKHIESTLQTFRLVEKICPLRPDQICQFPLLWFCMMPMIKTLMPINKIGWVPELNTLSQHKICIKVFPSMSKRIFLTIVYVNLSGSTILCLSRWSNPLCPWVSVVPVVHTTKTMGHMSIGTT